jgi:hypothetical protein
MSLSLSVSLPLDVVLYIFKYIRDPAFAYRQGKWIQRILETDERRAKIQSIPIPFQVKLINHHFAYVSLCILSNNRHNINNRYNKNKYIKKFYQIMVGDQEDMRLGKSKVVVNVLTKNPRDSFAVKEVVFRDINKRDTYTPVFKDCTSICFYPLTLFY